MPDLLIHPSSPLRGRLTVPGDKSITHRALMLAALADGETVIDGWVPAEVCLATLRCMQALGAEVEGEENSEKPCFLASSLRIRGRGLRGLTESADVLHCAGSGTTIRLLAGLVAGQPFTTVLTGTDPLRRRPMGRVAEPLRLMGATVLGRDGGRLPPLTIRGGHLRGIEYRLPVASAQVKSAILLAGLFADGETVIHEPGPSRDHTERMLRWFGVQVESDGPRVRLAGGQSLHARPEPLVIPGDFSSAAFPLVAATLVPGSNVVLENVGVNPTRTGLYDLLAAMGASLEHPSTASALRAASAQDASREPQLHATEHPERSPHPDGRSATGMRTESKDARDVGEPVAALHVRAAALRGVEVGGDLVVRAIDEFPIFAVAATQAQGTTVVREAAELRVKESDRIATVAAELRKMGADIEEHADGMTVRGPTKLHGATVDCHRDHRLAMALAVAGLVADGPTTVCGAEAIDDSFPGFVEAMQSLGAPIAWADVPGAA